MKGYTPSFNYYAVIATANTVTLPLPTAYNYPSNYIPVLDALSCKVTDPNTASAATWGGTHKAGIAVNATGSLVFAVISDMGFSQTAAASGVRMSNNIWESSRGVPIWASATSSQSDPSLPVTAWYLRNIFTGTAFTTAASIEVFLSFHYEDPAQRR